MMLDLIDRIKLVNQRVIHSHSFRSDLFFPFDITEAEIAQYDTFLFENNIEMSAIIQAISLGIDSHDMLKLFMNKLSGQENPQAFVPTPFDVTKANLAQPQANRNVITTAATNARAALPQLDALRASINVKHEAQMTKMEAEAASARAKVDADTTTELQTKNAQSATLSAAKATRQLRVGELNELFTNLTTILNDLGKEDIKLIGLQNQILVQKNLNAQYVGAQGQADDVNLERLEGELEACQAKRALLDLRGGQNQTQTNAKLAEIEALNAQIENL
jgi:hypothetical protein